MSVISFPEAVKRAFEEGKTLSEDWPWDEGLGKPTDMTPCDVEPRDINEPVYEESPATKILKKASGLIDGERNVQHGDRKECHTLIARLWTAYLGVQITAKEVALMMCLLKIARTKSGSYNGDCYVDLCGYGSLAGELAKDA